MRVKICEYVGTYQLPFLIVSWTSAIHAELLLVGPVIMGHF